MVDDDFYHTMEPRYSTFHGQELTGLPTHTIVGGEVAVEGGKLMEQCYFGTQPVGHRRNRAHKAQLLALAGGADTVTFSTDHPHPDFDPPGDVLATFQTHMDDEQVRGVMGETALEVFGVG